MAAIQSLGVALLDNGRSLGVALLDNGEVSTEPEPSRWFRGRMRGYVLALVAVLAVSPDAVLLRFVRQHSHHSTNCANATPAECNAHMLMVLIFVKYTMMGSIQALFTVWHCGGVRPLVAAVRSSWRPLVVPSTFMLLTQIGFTVSLLETTAANAIMFFSLNPLWAATMGFFFLSDKVERHTLFAMGIAGGAVAFAFIPTVLGGDGSGEDGTAQPEGASGPTLHGNLIALATGVSLAAFITGSRYGSLKDANAPMSAAPALGSLGAALVAAPVALRYIHHLSSRWFLLFIFLDALLEACYDLAMGLAAEHITSAEVALVLLLEIPLGPLFVFLFFGEVPPLFTIIGCVVLALALVGHGVVEARSAQEAVSLSRIDSPLLSLQEDNSHRGSPASSKGQALSRPTSFVAFAAGPRRVYSYSSENLVAMGGATSPFSHRASSSAASPPGASPLSV